MFYIIASFLLSLVLYNFVTVNRNISEYNRHRRLHQKFLIATDISVKRWSM